MRNNTYPLRDPAQRGSALLIVLGFLSFMMISAVAFAIYMRIERQASSNYRHAASARHMLNAALYRAMDEVDSDLRATAVAGAPNPRKFPDWPGRVRTSAVVNSVDNGGNARVLTLGALCYIPGVLLNDVRYYALPRPAGAPNAEKGYLGVKWRPLSMPLVTMEGRNAYEEAVIGRYSYLCINVSDMLNVNYCKAQVRDGAENRVSIGHLFKDDAQRKVFDNRVKDTDLGYTTLEDFYACMFEMGDSSPFRSPWHDYFNTGYDLVPFRTAAKHILIADGVAMAEPPREGGFNVLELKAPPVDIVPKDAPCNAKFVTALDKAFLTTSGAMPKSYVQNVLNNALADYLDADSIPKRVDIPSVEMTPMISAISVPASLMFAINVDTIGKRADDSEIKMSRLVLTDIDPIPIAVKVIYPFKYSSLRNKEPLTLKVQGYLKIHYDANLPLTVGSYMEPPLGQRNTGFYVFKLASTDVPLSDTYPDDDPDFNKYVNRKDLILKVEQVLTPGGTMALDLIDDKGVTANGFTAGNSISFSLVLNYAVVKSGVKCVDLVPVGLIPPEGAARDEDIFLEATEKLYFKGEPLALLQPLVSSPAKPFKFVWTCLEAPDPRFNWKCSNWVKSDSVEADSKVNKSTLDMLGIEGRDADIFLSVSDAGYLQSPGELGFIVRPFEYNSLGSPALAYDSYSAAGADFRAQSDYESMYRTIRLYDHGVGDAKTHRQDDIYQYLTAGDPQKPLIGARVNPLSDIPLVLSAAIERVPLDYWVSSQITDAIQKGNAVPAKYLPANFSELLKGESWKNYTNGWIHAMQSVRDDSVPFKINADLKTSVRDKYGRDSLMGWYSDDKANRDKMFEPEVSINKALHEVDRKMLYSFSLDSFSDRQQLFLYVISAEATAPSLGDSVTSLAGGKAIALVWRDPYPKTNAAGNALPPPSNMYNDGMHNNNRISPWYQHHRGIDDRSKESYDDDQDGLARSPEYYEQKVLYFKYLEN